VAVEGRKVTLEAVVKDEIEDIGTGTHARFVVDVEKTIVRLRRKAAQLAAGAGARSGIS